jgi:hypothetical protein
MDIVYYWKNHAADVKAGRLGSFKTTPARLAALADGYPDFLWAFKPAAGRKGDVQLIARLRWVDKSTAKTKGEAGQACMYYDPHSEQSITYADSGSDTAIAQTTQWVATHFPKMLTGTFPGTAGQEGLRGAALTELQMLASHYGAQPFMSPVEA